MMGDGRCRWLRWVLSLTGSCLAVGALSGCAVVGPRSISGGRAAYAEAINRTEDEQILLSIVKGRYGETSSLLAVGTVAANLRFSARAGIEAGFGADDVSGDNLLIGGLAYEENPTITYIPVQGQEYVLQLTSPIPLDLFVMSLRSETSVDRLLTLLLNRVNTLRNPDFWLSPEPEATRDFRRFVALFTTLHRVGVLDVLKSSTPNASFDLLLSDYAPRYSSEVSEFLALLELPPAREPADIVIPAYFAISSTQSQGLRITTRSTYDLVEIFRAAVAVPQEHVLAGLAVDVPPMGLPGQGLKISASKEKPKGLSLAIRYRGYWFYISETDQTTKAYFNLVRTLWSISIAGAVDRIEAPVYTIPVSQ